MATEYEIPMLERTKNGRRSMRSIADALEALRGDGHLENCSRLEIRTNPLPSQTNEAPSLVLVVCHLNSPEEPWGVALPTSWEFRGRPLGKSTPETFEMLRIDRAKVDEDGTVTLSDGTRLKAVEVIPAALPWELQAVRDGISPSEIGIFVRSRDQLDRARTAVKAAGFNILELSGDGDDHPNRISIGTMHMAKGLEFKAVVVMACDDEVLPLQSRIEAVADEVELDDVYETERQLLYVACTRARDRLMVSCVQPGSEFLADLD